MSEISLDLNWLVSLIIFSTILIITPGPNNIMLTSSGSIFGFRKTLPHIFGVAFGSPVLLFAIAIGGSFFINSDLFRYLLTVMSILYLAWLAFNIAVACPSNAVNTSRPLTFFQAANFQWINPKVWNQYIIAVGIYINKANSFIIEIIIIAIIFSIIGVISCCCWTIFGKFISRFLLKPIHFKIFNISMALLLLSTVLPILISNFIKVPIK